MIADDFGGDDVEAPTLEHTDNVVPFPKMREHPTVAARWADTLKRENARRQKNYQLQSPLDALDALVRKREQPRLPWPDAWGEIRARCVTYVGECIGISGPSGGGKTSFAIQMARQAIGDGIPVLWLPLELDNAQVDLRFVANVTGIHTAKIHDTWNRDQLARGLQPFQDHLRYIDRRRDPREQITAIRDAVQIAKSVYGRAPVVFLDYIGKMARGVGREPRQVLADAIEEIRDLTVTEECYTVMLSQTSRGNNAVLTGKVDLESAADAIGVSAETAELEHACAVTIALNVFKEDDADVLQCHVLVSKARGTGREGRVGAEFIKAGGVWKELPSLPPTPGEVRVEVKKQQKSRPDLDEKSARNEINATRSLEADRKRAELVRGALAKAGAIGLKHSELKRMNGCGSNLTKTLHALMRDGAIEQLPTKQWRIIARSDRP